MKIKLRENISGVFNDSLREFLTIVQVVFIIFLVAVILAASIYLLFKIFLGLMLIIDVFLTSTPKPLLHLLNISTYALFIIYGIYLSTKLFKIEKGTRGG